jgi:hypothetical protein
MQKSTPERHNKPWKEEEESAILGMIQVGKSYDEISTQQKRTSGAIKSKLRDLACRFVYEGKTIEEASRLTRVPLDDIEYSMKLRDIADDMRQKKIENKHQSQLTFKQIVPEVKEETSLSVLKEIRDMMKMFLASQPQVAVVPVSLGPSH